MSLPHRGDAHLQGRVERLQQHPGSRGRTQENLLGFQSSGTQWEQEMLGFLRANPASSLLPIVRHLWPEFLSLPAERRAQAWFWVKEQLRALEEQGVLRSEAGDDGVATWTLA